MRSVPKRDNRFHGILVVDKPGLARFAPSAAAWPVSDAVVPPTYARRVEPIMTGHSSHETVRLPTSHDIVQSVRRWSGQRRIGHTGTLDPMASGVLVLCLGLATRLVEYYQGHPKQYEAEVVLGTATDTYDATGTVMASAPIPPLSSAVIDQTLEQFRGPILQTPPVYSALKQAGEVLYRKARRGEEIAIEPRPVTIYRLDLIAFQPPDGIWLRVVCSAGTYIRSLAHDLGQALGTAAHLGALRRTAAGSIRVDQAHNLAVVEQAAAAEGLAELMQPLGYGLQMPVLCLNDEIIRSLGYGQQTILDYRPPEPNSVRLETSLDAAAEEKPQDVHLAQAVDARHQFAGIIRCLGPADSQTGRYVWKAEKWFAEP